jgi:hypothetical protein
MRLKSHHFRRRQKHGRDQKANSDVIDNMHSRALLRPVAAVPVVSAVNQSDGSLFGVCGSLKRLVRNVGAKNFLVSFGVHPTAHGIHSL